MGNRVRALAILATAIGLFLVVALPAGSRWVFKNNMDALRGGWRSRGPMYTPSSDPAILMDASKYADTENGKLVKALTQEQSTPNLQLLYSYAKARPHDPAAWAHLARYSSQGLLSGLKGKGPQTSVTRNELNRMLMEATGKGRELDPNNSFFVFLRSCCLLDQGQREQSERELALAASMPIYREYLHQETAARLASIEETYGYRGEYAKVEALSRLMIPHLVGYRYLGQDLFRNGSAKAKRDLLVFSTNMTRGTESALGLYVAPNLAAAALLGDPYLKPAKTVDLVLAAQRLDTQLGDSAATDSVEYLLTLDKVNNDRRQHEGDYGTTFGLGWSDIAGVPVIAALILLPLFSLLFFFTGAKSAGRDGQNAIAHVAAATAYILLYMNLSIEESWANSMMLSLALGHAALSFAHRSHKVSRLVLFATVLVFGLIAVMAGDPERRGWSWLPPLIGIGVCIYLVRLPAERLPQLATKLGWALSAASLMLMFVLSFEAFLPIAVYALSRLFLRATERLELQAWTPAVAVVLLSLAGGMLIFYMQCGGFDETNSYAIVLACAMLLAVIACRMQKLSFVHFAGSLLTLAMLYLFTTGFALAKNQQTANLTREFMHSADSVRQTLTFYQQDPMIPGRA